MFIEHLLSFRCFINIAYLIFTTTQWNGILFTPFYHEETENYQCQNCPVSCNPPNLIVVSSPSWQILSPTKFLKSEHSGITHIPFTYIDINPICKCCWLYHQKMSKICLLYHFNYHSSLSHHHLVNTSQIPG